MKKQYFALFGILGPVVAILFIIVAIVLSPWFNWGTNALSDLGHSVNSDVAPIFNFGLLLGGFLTITYSLTVFQKQAKYTSYFVVFVGLSLQLVAVFDEVYGSLHFAVSVLFFVVSILASGVYFLEKRSVVAVVALLVGFVSWVFYGLGLYVSGIAVPETVSAIVTASWVVLSAVREFTLNYD